MKRFSKRVLGFGLIVFILAGCGDFGSDVDFTKSVLKRLIAGHHSVRGDIAWTVFQIKYDDWFFKDVAGEYARKTDNKAREGYQRGFIDGFSKGFKAKKNAGFAAFFNWRQASSDDPSGVLVEANCYDEKTLMTFHIIREKGKRKLSRLEMKWLAGYPSAEAAQAEVSQ